MLAAAAFSVGGLSAADARVSAFETISPTYQGKAVIFKKGGRIGNWLAGSGNNLVMDASIPVNPPVSFSFLTNTFAFSSNTLTPALTLISDPSVWQAGAGETPAATYYLGNPWFCPGTPTTAYMLFQAQKNKSNAGNFGQPGGGYDNDIWVYRPAMGSAPPKVWRLTNYGNAVSGLGPAVLGPQCSQDSSSSMNTLHIVYGRLIPRAPTSTCNSGNGPSNGNCWWFGHWELVVGDVNFVNGNPAYDPACNGCNEPGLTQSTIQHVNPRDNAGNPFFPASGTGTLSGTTLTVSNLTSGTLAYAMVGGGIALTTNTGTFYTLITCYDGYSGDYGGTCGSGKLVIAGAPPNTFTGNFAINNYALFEAHGYASYLGNVYLTSNRRPPYHDAVGAVYNLTSQSFQEVTAARPPFIISGVVNSNPFANMFWDEFFTPDPSLTHAFFMSDRATTSASNLGVDPEWSDHYMCDGAGCVSPTRLTYFNDTGIDATLGCGPGGYTDCFPITAVRAAWSPDSTQMITLVEYLTRANNHGLPAAALYRYTFQQPNTELTGYTTLSGYTKLGKPDSNP